MKRREALEKTSWILKSAIFAPGIISALQSCQNEAPNSGYLLVLNEKQHELINAIADTIIPGTHTPSASDVKVGQFIDLLLKDVFEEENKQKFLDGLSEFNQACQKITGKSFTELEEKERFNYLEKVDAETMGQSYDNRVPFYYTFKHLTVSTYFSSEEGVKQNLNYLPLPGPYQGNIELKPEDSISIGNSM